MKTKILKILISFIFLCTVHSNFLYAVTNEVITSSEIIEDTQEEIINDISEQNESEVLIDENFSNDEEFIEEDFIENQITEEKEVTEITNEEEIKNIIVDEIVTAGVYQGAICIDSPTNYQTIVRPDVANLNVVGWAVTNDVNSNLRVLVDGNLVQSQIIRTKREDVDKLISPAYGGASITPNAGFTAIINTDILTAGSHILRIEAISGSGQQISVSDVGIKVENRKFQGAICIDSPVNFQNMTRPDNTIANIIGWAVTNDVNSQLRVLVDGKLVQSNICRTSRADINQLISPQYGGIYTTPQAGFLAKVNISNLDAGRHIIRVEVISRYGEQISVSDTGINIVNKKYEGAICIDSPVNYQNMIRPDDTKVNIVGWAVTNDSNSTLRILIDGNLVTSQIVRHQRTDVDNIISPAYGGTQNTPKAGFIATADISSLNVGKHSIRVEAISRYGEQISISDTGIEIVNKKYLGEMCIDMPTFNQTYTKGEYMSVGGWAVSQDENAIIKIYIDGNFYSEASRYSRADVSYFVQKYDGKTIYPGYGKLMNTNEFSVGTHTVTVYEMSRYGDIIGGVETKFIIKSNLSDNNNDNNNNFNHNINNDTDNNKNNNISGSKGIDVSQYQGNINWTSVKKSGIKYAMIRIGYRGYGSAGTLVEDSKFQSNFKNAVAAGLKVGVYFYSPSITVEEGKADADYIISILKKYGYQNQVSMPIAIDMELISGVNTRDKNLSKNTRTNVALAFCNRIAEYRYTPMVYACKSFLNDNMYALQIPYDIWVAQYNSKCTYTGNYTMWQYTSSGSVAGISGNVDCNICYKNY